jgi:hypothetical protein
MFIFLAILVFSGFMSVLFAGFLYYGIMGVAELLEVGIIMMTLSVFWLWYRVGPGRKVAEAAFKERVDKNDVLFKDIDVVLTDGRVINTKGLPRDKYGLPILPQ